MLLAIWLAPLGLIVNSFHDKTKKKVNWGTFALGVILTLLSNTAMTWAVVGGFTLPIHYVIWLINLLHGYLVYKKSVG